MSRIANETRSAAMWLKCDYTFDDRAVILTIERCEAVERPIKYLLKGDPETIEAMVIGYIEEHRPDLRGGLLYGIRFNFCRHRWEFIYGHRSLPRVPVGGVLSEMPLILEDEPLVVRSP